MAEHRSKTKHPHSELAHSALRSLACLPKRVAEHGRLSLAAFSFPSNCFEDWPKLGVPLFGRLGCSAASPNNRIRCPIDQHSPIAKASQEAMLSVVRAADAARASACR